MTPAGRSRGRVAMRKAWPLAQHIEERGLGAVFAAETGFLLARDPDTVRAPDAAFVRRERGEELEKAEGYWARAAGSSGRGDISRRRVCSEGEGKVTEWLRAGTRMVIVVNPSNRTVKIRRGLIEVAALTEDDEIDGADVVQEWRLPARKLFGD